VIRRSRILEKYFSVIDSPEMQSMLGGSLEKRMRDLSEPSVVHLESTRDDQWAIFKFEGLGSYRSLYFDLEEPDRPFAWATLAWLFNGNKAKKVSFSSLNPAAGDPFRAVRLGFTWNRGDGRCFWQLDAAEWQLAWNGRRHAERSYGDAA
jgi:hypothetical protein